MKKKLIALSVFFFVVFIFSNPAFCEKWEVKKSRDNLGSVCEVAQVKNSEGYIFTVEEGFYTIGTITIPNKFGSASMDEQIVMFQIDNYGIKRKTPQFHSNGKEIDIELNEEDIKRMAKGKVVKISYYKKGGKLINIKFDLNGSCIALSRIFDSPRFFSCKNDSGLQKALAESITMDFRNEGWHDLTFKVTGLNTITVRQANITQQKKLSDGQVVSWLGSILKPDIISKLKNAGFNKGIAIDGKSRKYPFEISTKYYDELMTSMQNAIRR